MAANIPENKTPSNIEKAYNLFGNEFYLLAHFNIHSDIFFNDLIS